MDMKINDALNKQEGRINDEASYFMRDQENELRDIINKMNEKLLNNDEKDDLIKTLREQSSCMK